MEGGECEGTPWRDCEVARLASIVMSHKDFELHSDFDDGSEVQVVAQQPYKMRLGQKAFPMTGFACICTALTPNMEVTLLLIKIDEVLKQGVSLSDVTKFCDSPYGSGLVAKAQRIVLSNSDFLYIPFGYIVIPVYVPSGEPATALVPDSSASAIFLHSAVMSAPSAIHVGESVFNAIYSNCHEHCSQHAQQVEYANRIAMLEKFKAKVTF